MVGHKKYDAWKKLEKGYLKISYVWSIWLEKSWNFLSRKKFLLKNWSGPLFQIWNSFLNTFSKNCSKCITQLLFWNSFLEKSENFYGQTGTYHLLAVLSRLVSSLPKFGYQRHCLCSCPDDAESWHLVSYSPYSFQTFECQTNLSPLQLVL